MSKNRDTPSPLLDTVILPWDVDSYHGRYTDAPRETSFAYSKAELDPRLPTRLFTIPLDILEQILSRMTKKDAFQLSKTCKTFMRHPLVLKTIFYEPISIAEIRDWYQVLSDHGSEPALMVMPPVTRGINTSTGPWVRRLALPEWTSEQDIHHLTAHCPNLDGVDFSEIFESLPRAVGRRSHRYPEYMDFWPPRLNRCPALFRNLRSVHLPYGYWQTAWSRLGNDHKPRTASIPKILSLAKNLRTLFITCQQEPPHVRYSHTRRKASAKLLADILNFISRGLTTLILHESVSTINNLENFLQSLAVFPDLRTIKISLHRDLSNYQAISHLGYDPNSIVHHISSQPNEQDEHETTSVFQYLSIIKKISDKGRFSLISSDGGEGYRCLPREYYGLCQSELVLGPRDDLWAPVWTWNDRMNWVQSHKYHPGVEVMDVAKCRALFEELRKARIRVSIELEPLRTSNGAIFAAPWAEHGRYDDTGSVSPEVASYDTVPRPKQHFIQRPTLTTVTSETLSLHYEAPVGTDERSVQTVPADPILYSIELGYSEYIDRHTSQPKGLAQPTTPLEETANSNGKSHINSDASKTIKPNTDIPDPVWRLNKVGDLVDDLRLALDQRFAHVYAKSFAEDCDPNRDGAKWSEVVDKCRTHLRDRLWREAEQTALLFRRIPVDFPLLTRFALYIPTALYPNRDQTFIDHALPGTGWTVSRYGKHHDSVGVGGPRAPVTHMSKLADDICPFVHRVFTRPTPTDDASAAAAVIHDEEWHVTKRPLFDLDGEYKSMEQLLTEPLGENYTVE